MCADDTPDRMDVVIPATVVVLGCGLVVFGAAIRAGVVRYLPGFDPDPALVDQITRGGAPAVLAGLLSIGVGVLQWYRPLPNVGWLVYTLTLIGLLFLGGARIGGDA